MLYCGPIVNAILCCMLTCGDMCMYRAACLPVGTCVCSQPCCMLACGDVCMYRAACLPVVTCDRAACLPVGTCVCTCVHQASMHTGTHVISGQQWVRAYLTTGQHAAQVCMHVTTGNAHATTGKDSNCMSPQARIQTAFTCCVPKRVYVRVCVIH